LVFNYNSTVIKAIGNNEERKRNHSTQTQDFNMENPLQQREVKTMAASDGWRVVDDDDYNQSVGNPKRKV
jgi:hypothetical protein